MIKRSLLYAALLLLGLFVAVAWADSEPYSPQSATSQAPQPAPQPYQSAPVAPAPYAVYNAAQSQTYAVCPPGQVAAYPTSQLWANQYDVHTAWECFVPRSPAFDARYSAVPDPALHGALPSMTGRSSSGSSGRSSSSSSSSSATASATSGQTSTQVQAEVKVDVNVGVDLSVSTNGGAPLQSSTQVSAPTVSATVSAPSGQSSVQPGSLSGSQSSASNQSSTTGQSAGQTSGQISPVLPNALPVPIAPNNGAEAAAPVIPAFPSLDDTTPNTSAIIPPNPDTQALLNAQPVLPSTASGGSRGIQ